MSSHQEPYAIQLKDYRPPSYSVDKVDLTIELDPELTLVTSRVLYRHRPGHDHSLRLAGKDLSLLLVQIDGQDIDLKSLDWSSEHLQLTELPATFELVLKTSTRPQLNKALEGIYLSQGKFYSQCEPEGFRRITYYLDRPDVMAEFRTNLIADRKTYPILLSNGNLLEKGQRPDGRHYAVWHDPFPKPSYLFAVVAGDLSSIQDSYTTRSGRKVDLHIYVEHENIGKCAFAMEAIKRAMRWDEEVYQLEYDLDLFMVVAVSDFNMGAMENKGLNIFNSKYVLASAETATDSDFENILAVVGHEYFHNWTGNRITLRDWFQLSLKEGLTVFRDQHFSADQGSHAVKRIQEVKVLREVQFPEDNGPMAHAVRPESYIEINNFYTSTVYNKGAEIIRMLYGMLGPDVYHQAMQRFFQTFDGQAVTIEQFLDLMSQASGHDLKQFKRWYEQPGTPRVSIELKFDRAKQVLALHVRQEQEKTKSSQHIELRPLQIPLRLAFLAKDGRPLDTRYAGKLAHEHVVVLDQLEQDFTFENVGEEVIASVFRNFSAPVNVSLAQSRSELLTLLAHETDAFNRFEAAQVLFEQVIVERCRGLSELDPNFSRALQKLLREPGSDPRLSALSLTPPSIEFILQKHRDFTLEQIFDARNWLLQSFALFAEKDLAAIYQNLHPGTQKGHDREAIGGRELKNACLAVLSYTQKPLYFEWAELQATEAQNMSDAVAALTLLASQDTPARERCLDAFYRKWQKDPLVIDKWFSLQANSAHPEVLQQVKELLQHKDFDEQNPNRVYSLFRPFARSAPHGFHHLSGDGYRLVADYALQIDRNNPQVASTLTSLLSRFRSYDATRQKLMRTQLERMIAHKDLSRDVFEVASKSLHNS